MTLTLNNLTGLLPVAALSFAGAFTTLPAVAQTTLEDVIAAAAEEGEVAINVGTTRFPAGSGPEISAAIADYFGIEIDVALVNTSPVPVMAGQIVEETAAGITPSFDLFPLPLSFTASIAEGGAIEEIDWAGIGVDPEFIDPNGNAVWIDTVPRAVFYNTNLVSGDDIPTKLEDLLDPMFQGQIAGPGFGDAYTMVSVPVLGEEAAAEWLSTLYDDQGLTVIRSMADVPSRVAQGEFMIGMGIPANRSGLVDKGAPLANAPLESVGGQPYYMFVVKDAPNTNAAALLSYFFCCTQEGKDALFNSMGWAKFDYEGSEQNAIGGEGRGQVPTAEWQLTQQARVASEFDALIGR
ncbi:MAG: ABC transporter substrate-binding protein [Octadecabacter sp.]